MIENQSRRFGKFVCGAFVDFEDPEYYLICDNCGKGYVLKNGMKL